MCSCHNLETTNGLMPAAGDLMMLDRLLSVPGVDVPPVHISGGRHRKA